MASDSKSGAWFGNHPSRAPSTTTNNQISSQLSHMQSSCFSHIGTTHHYNKPEPTHPPTQSSKPSFHHASTGPPSNPPRSSPPQHQDHHHHINPSPPTSPSHAPAKHNPRLPPHLQRPPLCRPLGIFCRLPHTLRRDARDSTPGGGGC